MKMSKISVAKLLSVAFLAIVSCFNISFAQNGQRGNLSVEERAESQTNMMQEKLTLSETQKTAVYEINLKYAEKAEAILAGGRSRDTMQKMRSMGQEKDKEMKKVLDGKQYESYLLLKEEMMQKMRRQ